MNGLYQLYLARLREFRREPSAFFFVLFVPILWMLVLGFSIDKGGPRPKKVGLLTPGVSSVSERPGEVSAIQGVLTSLEGLHVVSGSVDELHRLLKRGELNLLVDFEPLPDGKSGLVYAYDRHNPEAEEDRLWVDRQIQRAMGQQDVLATRDDHQTVYGTRYVDFLIPGLLAVSILSTSLFGVGMTIVSHRKDGLLKQLFVTPLNPRWYLMSHILSRGTILLVEGGALLIAAWLIFQFRVTGSWMAFGAISLLGAGATTSLATVLASRLSHTGAMNGLSNIVMLPVMLLSGAWFSRTHFPGWLQTVSGYLPLTPLVDGLRKIALEGAGWSGVWNEMAILGVYLVVGVGLSGWLFKWYEFKPGI